MVDDILQGAVLPPIVLGVVLEKAQYRQIPKLKLADFRDLVKGLESDRISIIDGMQRTSALMEAAQSPIRLDSSAQVRIEYWISQSSNSLIYRMLVLNTGQVPWNLRRQIEVVFRSLIVEVKQKVTTISVLEKTGDGGRRTRAGQFQADELVELFLVFGSRKERIDIRERLADEFSRLDFVEAASDNDFTNYFCQTLTSLAALDLAFDTHKKKGTNDGRFSVGKDVFGSLPACVGFMTAVAIAIYGRPGISRDKSLQDSKLQEVTAGVVGLVTRLKSYDADALKTFLDLQTLNEALQRVHTSKSVGDAEREFFLKAFQVLIEERFQVDSLSPCWRAY